MENRNPKWRAKVPTVRAAGFARAVKSMPAYRVIALGLIVTASSGCTSAGLKGGAAPTDFEGIHYHVAKDVVVIDLTVTEKVTREVTTRLEIETLTETTREGTASLKAVPDRSNTFSLDLEPGGLTDGEITVELSPGGLLRSINAKTTGRTGEVIQSVAKFAATVSGLGPLAGFAAAATGCDPFLAEFLELPLVVRHYLGKSTPGCTLWREIKALEVEVGQFEKERKKLEATVPGLGDAQLQQVTAKIKLLKAAAAGARASITKKQAAFSAKLEQHKVTNQLGTRQRSWRLAEVLELKDLPPPLTVVVNDDETTAATNLASYAAAKTAFQRTGAVVLLEALTAPSPAQTLPAIEKDVARVFFRQAQTLRLSLLVLEQKKGASAPRLKLASNQVVDVLHTNSPTLHLAFKTSAWAERGLTLEFDERGRPKKMTRTGTSDAAAATAAIASAATGFRDELAATLSKVKDIQTTRREIELSDLSDNLARLTKEKEVLDAQLALSEGNATFDTVLRQKQLAADLATLQAEINLRTAESTSEQKIEIELLKVQIEQLKQELDLLKARQALAEAED